MTDQPLNTQQTTITKDNITLARTSMYNLFSDDQLTDIIATARERGRSVHGLIRDAILDDLAR